MNEADTAMTNIGRNLSGQGLRTTLFTRDLFELLPGMIPIRFPDGLIPIRLPGALLPICFPGGLLPIRLRRLALLEGILKILRPTPRKTKPRARSWMPWAWVSDAGQTSVRMAKFSDQFGRGQTISLGVPKRPLPENGGFN